MGIIFFSFRKYELEKRQKFFYVLIIYVPTMYCNNCMFLSKRYFIINYNTFFTYFKLQKYIFYKQLLLKFFANPKKNLYFFILLLLLLFLILSVNVVGY